MLTIYFFDTNILLSHLDFVEKQEEFYISSITINELEGIKTSGTKSDEVKFKSRCAVRWLSENMGKYHVVIWDNNISSLYQECTLEDVNDTRIVKCADYIANKLNINDLIFCTNDILCKLIAENYFKLKTVSINKNEQIEHKGYTEKSLSNEDMAYFYEHNNENIFGLLINEYVVIKDENNETVDVYRWTGTNHEAIKCRPFKSTALGTVKPFDEIQGCAMDSIVNNEITVLYGRSGSGKTTIPLSYIMQSLEKGKCKKCYIVYSYEPLKGAKTLGYEKGDHLTKLLYTASIGNILASKLGDMQQVEYYIERDMIDIIPTANIRGVEFGSDSICFVTEAQNLDTYTLKTIIQRCKSGCKQIYEGDIIEQKDVKIEDSGIKRVIDVFKGHNSFGCVKLKNNYRNEICSLADSL